MSTSLITTRADETTITEAWFDEYLAALSGDLVPRDASCIPGDLAASLGTSSLPWRRIHVASGGFRAGDIKKAHSYNGLVGPGHGWMLCDGRLVSESNYNAEHGTGTWAARIGDSPLAGKYLPNLVHRYARGKSATAQDGASAITPVGNAGNQRNIAHVHKWYHPTGTTTSDQSFDSGGSAAAFAVQTKNAGVRGLMVVESPQAGQQLGQDLYTGLGGNAALSVQPESIEFLYYMRII